MWIDNLSRTRHCYPHLKPTAIIARVSALTTIAATGPKRGAVCAIAILLAAIIPPAAFYGWFELHSRITADHHALDSGYANALKHAEAAATLYSSLRLIGANGRTSEHIVVRLGNLNELAEIYVKLGRKDSTLEMMRDLHNNMVGIAVAKWREHPTASDRRSRTQQLIALTRAGVLLQSEDDVRLSPEEMRRAKQSADLDWAISWLNQNKPAIEQRAMQALTDTRL